MPSCLHYIFVGARGTGIRQSQAILEKPGGATKQGLGLSMSVSWIVHDSMVKTGYTDQFLIIWIIIPV